MSKPFVERLVIDKTNIKILNENRPKISSFAAIKKGFIGQLWNNVKANWLMLVFCLPVVAWIFISKMKQVDMDTTIAYSGNLGLGYPVANDAAIIGAAIDMQLAMRRALIMMPMIIVGAVGLAGVFNVAKYLYWGLQIKIIKTFLRGVKNSFAPFLWVGMMLAVCFLLATYVLNVFNVYTDVHMVWQVLSYIGLAVLCLVVAVLSVFVTTQAAVFNLTLPEILKNSALISFKFVLQTIIVAAIGLVGMTLPLLNFNNFVTIIANMLFFMLAFSWMAAVWTVYSHYMFDMFYIDKTENKGTIELKPETAQKDEKKQRKTEPKKPFQNPKKKKKQQ